MYTSAIGDQSFSKIKNSRIQKSIIKKNQDFNNSKIQEFNNTLPDPPSSIPRLAVDLRMVEVQEAREVQGDLHTMVVQMD